MVVRRGVATGAFAGLLLVPQLATAQAFTASPTVTASAGYAATKTFYDSSTEKPESRSGPVISLGPAIGLTFETPRTLHDLQAVVVGTLPISSKPTPLVTGNLTYTSHYELSEFWNLDLVGALGAIPPDPLVTSTSASSSTIEARPSTTSLYNLSANAQQTLTRELSPDTRVTQAANVVYNVPYDTGTKS